MRISRVLAMTVLSLTPDSTGAAIALAQNFRPPSHVSELSKRPSRPMAQFHSDNLLEEASLTFVVSVCLADLEYTSACREVSLLEATKRLEQIYLDGYAMRRAAGSLKVWFPPRVERSEQLRFLRAAGSIGRVSNASAGSIRRGRLWPRDRAEGAKVA